MDSAEKMNFWRGKSYLINFILLILFSVFIVVLSYKESGGDIFAWFAIFGFALLQFLICATVRAFKEFNILKNLLFIGIGLLVSVGILLIAISMGTN